MKTLGLLGGMSWESSALYYRWINEHVKARLGGLHSAKVVLHSVDFDDIARMQRADDWAGAARVLGDAGAALRAAGAELLLICTNTMHLIADEVEARAGLPLLHIVDPTAAAIRASGIARIGLIGTRFTMERDFYTRRLRDRHGIDALVPGAEDRDLVHRVIYDELCLGQVRDESRAAFRAVIARLVEAGAQAIILGCTEIAMLIGAADSPVPVFDTTVLHAQAAADWSLR
jgi:aspartate racemase